KLPDSCGTFANIVAEMNARYKVRPILVTDRYDWGVGQTVQTDRHLLLPSQGGQYLELTVSELTQVSGFLANKRGNLLWKTFNMAYLVGAVIYHCKQLALTYSRICND